MIGDRVVIGDRVEDRAWLSQLVATYSRIRLFRSVFRDSLDFFGMEVILVRWIGFSFLIFVGIFPERSSSSRGLVR